MWNLAKGRGFGRRAVVLAALAGCHAGSACSGCFGRAASSTAETDPSDDGHALGTRSPASEEEKNRSKMALLIYAAELERALPSSPASPVASSRVDLPVDVPEPPVAVPSADAAVERVEVADATPDDTGIDDSTAPSPPEVDETGATASQEEPDAEATSSTEPDADGVPPQVMYILPFYMFPRLPQHVGR